MDTTTKDSKWSWVVLSVVTFVMFLEVGTLKAFSILLPDLKEQLSSQTWIIGSHISFISGWGSVLGLIAGGLVKKFGARSSFMICGLISSAGLIVCACAINVLMLFLGLILSGFVVLQEIVAVGIVPEYFDKYYNVAVNTYCFGNALGVIIAPLLAQTSLDVYGWRGTILLLCGLYLHSIPFGALLHNNQQRWTTLERAPTGKASFNSKIIEYFSTTLDIDLITTLPFITRVLVPSIITGYIFAAWTIYIVSFALSNGASMKESALVATSGGIGMAMIKLSLPFLNTVFTYRQLMYTGSLITSMAMALYNTSDSVIILSMLSSIFGIGLGMLGTELYIAAKDVAKDNQYVSAVAWSHLVFGLAMIAGATLTGLLFDMTGSFTWSFMLLAAVSLLTAVSLGVEDIWTRISGRTE